MFGLVRVKTRAGFAAIGISQLSDEYLIGSLRGMETRMPELDAFGNRIEIGYVNAVDEIADGVGFHNYEMFKLEAETRGLTWRVHPAPTALDRS